MMMMMNSSTTTTTTSNTITPSTMSPSSKQATHTNAGNVIVTNKELGDLLNFFSSHQSFRASLKDTDKMTAQIEDICIRLMARDYKNLIVIPNDKGHLSTSYPSKIVIPQLERKQDHHNNDDELDCETNATNLDGDDTVDAAQPNQQVPFIVRVDDDDEHVNIKHNYTESNQKFEVKKLKDLISKARVARCRARFPIPAILYKNKYICRSATLSSAAEIYGRSVLDYTFNDKNHYSQHSESDNVENCEDDDFVKAQIDDYSPPATRNMSDSTKMFSHFRNQDIKLLKYFSVKLICDLMLEKKKVKFGMNVTSSEKADKKNRYSDFNILSLPYPGCEFFREYRDNSYCGEGLIYDWNQDFVDAEFGLLNCDEIAKSLNLNFQEYRSWDVIKLTQNYIKLMLYFLKEFDSSILIHCISGWDRTPLFISLLRLSLWADGEIHKNLNAVEITYLTVAYDWFLFGHNLNDRLNKGEEIMFFCFQFLKFITGDDFSINDDLVSSQNDLMNQSANKHNDELSMIQSMRKISTESFTAYEDFIIENIPNSYKGSQTSLNRNHHNQMNNKHEDSFSLISADFEIESSLKLSNPLKQDLTDSTSHNGIESDQKEQDSLETFPVEMISTLTLNDDEPMINSNHFGLDDNDSNQQKETNSQLPTSIQTNHLHSSTKPVEIPNHKNNGQNGSQNINNVSDGSLCRSDSWQFVSDASSIIDNHHFSSPDSMSSLNNKKSTSSPMANCYGNQICSSSPFDHHHHRHNNNNHRHQTIKSTSTKTNKRVERLLEVRSLFNSAYTCINFNHINSGGCSLSNFVNHIYQTVNI